MFFPNFPIVFVFRFRPMQQPHFQVHSQFKYLFGCFYLQKNKLPASWAIHSSRAILSPAVYQHPIFRAGARSGIFFGTMSFYVSFAAPHFHFREKRLALPHSSFILLF